MQKIYWDLLKKNHKESKKRRIESLFESDQNRFRKFSLNIEDLYFDYSKTNIDPLTLSNLIKFAENSEIMKNVGLNSTKTYQSRGVVGNHIHRVLTTRTVEKNHGK